MNDMKMCETEYERQYAAATRSGEEKLRKHPLAITFLVTTKLNHRPWEVIVTPDDDQRLVVVVTAYPC